MVHPAKGQGCKPAQAFTGLRPIPCVPACRWQRLMALSPASAMFFLSDTIVTQSLRLSWRQCLKRQLCSLTVIRACSQVAIFSSIQRRNLVELKSCLSVCYRPDAPGMTRSHLLGEHIWCRFCRACLWTLSAAVYRAAACQSSCSSLWRLNQNDRHTGFLPCSIRPLTGLPRSGQRY